MDASGRFDWTNLDSRRPASKSSSSPASDPFALSHRRLTRCETNGADVRPRGSCLRLRVCVPPRQLFGSAGCGVKRNTTSAPRTLRRPPTVAEVGACGGLGGVGEKGRRRGEAMCRSCHMSIWHGSGREKHHPAGAVGVG